MRLGDKTTPCPRCGEPGVITDSMPAMKWRGIPTVLDGAQIRCGCPPGTNRLKAPLERPARLRTSAGRTAVSDLPAAATSGAQPANRPSSLHAPAPAQPTDSPILEPGFHVVPFSMSGSQLLARLLPSSPAQPTDRLLMLNPTFEKGYKAGELFVLGDSHAPMMCTREEAAMMAAAEQVRSALAPLSEDEADFMARHQVEIAIMSGVSQSLGVSKDILDSGLQRIKDTVRSLEHLHQREFNAHGHLKSPAFFNARRELYQQLDGQLKSTFLNKPLNLGNYDLLRRDLGISTRSLVHHWNKAGVSGPIPGYATHMEQIAKTAKYLKYGGYVGTTLGGAASYMKVQEVCRAGETEECEKVRFTETGSFVGGMGFGGFGAWSGGTAASTVCVGVGAATAGVGGVVCGLILVGAGSYLGGEVGEWFGELIGETTYKATK